MPIRAERKNPPRKASTPAPAEPAPPPESPPVVGIETLWPAVLERVRDGEGGEMLAALLADARPAGLENDVLVLMYPQSASFSKRKIEDAANGERLVQALKLVAGRPLGVRIELRDLEADEDAGEEDMIERIKSTFDAEDLSEDPAPEDVPERSA
jgi:hypothetical protein